MSGRRRLLLGIVPRIGVGMDDFLTYYGICSLASRKSEDDTGAYGDSDQRADDCDDDRCMLSLQPCAEPASASIANVGSVIVLNLGAFSSGNIADRLYRCWQNHSLIRVAHGGNNTSLLAD